MKVNHEIGTAANEVSEYFSDANGVRNGRRIEFEAGINLSSKRASNRGRNGRQIEVETGVKSSSKRTSIQTIRPPQICSFCGRCRHRGRHGGSAVCALRSHRGPGPRAALPRAPAVSIASDLSTKRRMAFPAHGCLSAEATRRGAYSVSSSSAA